MKILILCTGNTCRSPMAEGIVQSLIAKQHLDHISVESMGFAAYDGDAPTAHAITVMKEINVDIQHKTARRVMRQDLIEEDIQHVYVMTPSHMNILMEAIPELEKKITVLDIPDPYGQAIDTYRHCRDELFDFFAQEIPQWSIDHEG